MDKGQTRLQARFIFGYLAIVLSFRALRIPREEGFVGVTSVSDFIRISKRASFIRPRDIYSSGISKKEILSAKI
jgi:hypothetical protein